MGDGKLSTVVSAINNSGSGVAAAIVQTGVGQYKLQVQSNTTGSAGAISTNFGAFESTLGHLQVVTKAQDAELQIGTGANAYTVTSSSNSISGAIAGVTMQVTSADPNKTISINVGGDVKMLSDNVKAMVDAINEAQTFIKDNSKYDATTKTAGALLGNSNARGLQSNLASAMSTLTSGNALGGLDAIGIKMKEDGTYSFDTAKFDSAYASNPEAVAAMFVDGGSKGLNKTGSPGLAERIATITKAATDGVNGSITTSINGEKSTIDMLTKQVDSWTERITRYKTC